MKSSMTFSGRRSWTRGLSVVSVVILGLALRSPGVPLHAAIVKYGGDALWALVIYLAAGVVFHRSPVRNLVWIAVLVSWGVEFSQLYHSPGLDPIRATLPGRLILGSTFNAPDLLAYAVGIAAGAWAESRHTDEPAASEHLA